MAGQPRQTRRGRTGGSVAPTRLTAAPRAAAGSPVLVADAPILHRRTAVEPALPQRPARATYRVLRMRGLSELEAANMTAFMAGIHAVDDGWTLREIERLLFVRSLVRSGRLVS